MNDKSQIEFIPYHAINEFMRNDFRLNVIKTALLALPKLDKKFGIAIDRLTRKHVKVSGFRNSVKAPATVKAVAMARAFEKQPKLVRAILATWSEAKTELRQEIFDLLVGREWKLLPIAADRTKIPGFLAQWPDEDDYEVLYTAYIAAYPDSEASIDEASLMTVWLAGRLPIEKVAMAELETPFLPDKPEEE
jgi:hypothetical protein